LDHLFNVDATAPRPWRELTLRSGQVYDAAGRVQARTLGSNILLNDYTYFGWAAEDGQACLGRSPEGRLQKIVTTDDTKPAVTLQDLRYTPRLCSGQAYDSVGNVLTIKDYYAGNPQTQTFTPRLRSGQAYDDADRLGTAVATGGSGGTYNSESYTLRLRSGQAYNGTTGNLTNKGGVSQSYADANHKHAVTSTGAGSTFQHDANGNPWGPPTPRVTLTQRVVGGQTYTLTYDAENHLTGVSGAATASMIYDGDGARVKATINGTTIVYVGNHTVPGDPSGDPPGYPTQG
jgi:hypothetical protein